MNSESRPAPASPLASPSGEKLAAPQSGDRAAAPQNGAHAERRFKITFLPLGKTVEASTKTDPLAHHEGLPGSILDWADHNDIPLEHACGGFAACSTCHVVVKQGLETCNESSEDEEDMLDEAPGLTLQSRLSCQCIPDGSTDLVVEIPAWNRNLVKEGRG